MSDRMHVDAAGLRQVAASLREGADALDKAASTPVKAPDAGVSSAVIGQTLATVVRALATEAHNLDGVAANVHAANGGYAEIENTNEGLLKLKSEYGGGPGNHVPDDPPMIAEPNSYSAPPPPAPDNPTGSNGPGDMSPEDVPKGPDGTPVGSLPEPPAGGAPPVDNPKYNGPGPG